MSFNTNQKEAADNIKNGTDINCPHCKTYLVSETEWYEIREWNFCPICGSRILQKDLLSVRQLKKFEENVRNNGPGTIQAH